MPQGAERYQRILIRFQVLQSLTGGWSEKLQYAKGLGVGILEGVWDSIKGIWDAVVFIVKLPYHVINFLTTTLPALAARFVARIAEHAGLLQTLGEKAANGLRELIADPVAAVRKLAGLLAGLERAGHEKAREWGRSTAGAIFDLLEQPWYEFGRGVGKITGMVLFEVVLALVSGLVGNLVKEVGAWAARLSARAVAAGAELFRGLARLVGTAAEWLRNLARRMGGALGELWEQIAEALRRFLGVIDDLAAAPDLAGASGVRLPVGAAEEARALNLESRAVKGGRTTGTKVSELKPSTVPEKPTAVEAPAARAERAVTKPSTPEVVPEPVAGPTTVRSLQFQRGFLRFRFTATERAWLALDTMPEGYAVYLVRNSSGKVIYVGQTGRTGWVRWGEHLEEKGGEWLGQASKFEFVAVGLDTEKLAFALEHDLMSSLRPSFNKQWSYLERFRQPPLGVEIPKTNTSIVLYLTHE